MGENIAHNAGVAIAFKAFHLSLGGRPAPVIDGYSGDQQFFLAYAQAYRSKDQKAFCASGFFATFTRATLIA